MGADVQAFYERFCVAWAARDPKLLAGVFAPGATVRQPPVREPFVAEQVEEYFTQIFSAMPSLRLEPTRWAHRENVVMIEWVITADAAGQTVSWSGVDRFELGPDGLAVDEAVYFDTLRLWETIDPSMRRDDLVQLTTPR